MCRDVGVAWPVRGAPAPAPRTARSALEKKRRPQPTSEPLMRTVKDVEAYLGRLNRTFSPVENEPHTFLVPTSGQMTPIAIRVDEPLVVLRVHVGDAPGKDNVALFRRLLELNARALVHSSYGLEGARIVLSSALELENLDFNELQATLDEMDLTLTQHVPELVGLLKQSS